LSYQVIKNSSLGLLLTAALALPLCGSPALADPGPTPALPVWQEQDTPDQLLPPVVYRPSAAEDAVEPALPAAEAQDAGAAVRAVPAAARRSCPVRTYRVACVDLSRQLMWVQQGRKIRFGAVPVRTGRIGFGTRRGWHRVYWKHKNHWSSLYGSPMPYSQFFSGGQAFHGIYKAVRHNPPGSMGCVNMSVRDAKRLWGVLRQGDRVYVWGRKSWS
jgi:lipoprotein-anchoring transpeptidase ErfK/SrfK